MIMKLICSTILIAWSFIVQNEKYANLPSFIGKNESNKVLLMLI